MQHRQNGSFSWKLEVLRLVIDVVSEGKLEVTSNATVQFSLLKVIQSSKVSLLRPT